MHLFQLPTPTTATAKYQLISETEPPSLTLHFEHMSKPTDHYLPPTQKKRMFGYQRLVQNEIVMPKSAFLKLGLPQPAFVSVSQPDHYLKLAIAYMSEND